MDSVSVSTGVLPFAGGLAIDDPNVRIRLEKGKKVLRRRAITAVVLAVAFGLSVVIAVLGEQAREAAPAFVIGLALVLFVQVLVREARTFKWYARLVARFPWQPAGAAVVREGRAREAAQLAVTFYGRPMLLLLSARAGRPLVLRTVRQTGQVWLCGPDEAGWVALRIVGSTFAWRVRLSDGAPAGPASRVVSSPSSAWGIGLAVLNTVAVLAFGAVPLVIGWRREDFVDMVCGEILVVFGLLRAFALVWVLVRVIRQRRLKALPELAAAASFRLASWRPGGALAGEAHLPDGRVLTLVVPRANLDLAANVQAGAPVRVVGEGERLAVAHGDAEVLSPARIVDSTA